MSLKRFLGRGFDAGNRMAGPGARKASRKAYLLPAAIVAILHELLGTKLWHPELCRPRWVCSVNKRPLVSARWAGRSGVGQPDWDHGKVIAAGVAEDHDSNPIKMGISKIKARGSRVISVNPVRSGYNAVADDWFGITPGTDGLLILALVHELFKAGKIDLSYLADYTNAACLINAGDGPEKGLLLREAAGKLVVMDRATKRPMPFDHPDVKPDLRGGLRHGGVTHTTVFRAMAEKFLDPQYSPEAVADRCGISAERIKAFAAELAQIAFEEEVVLDTPWTDFRGRRHEKMVGRPVSFHAMRGISAHANGFQTCRALHVLQILLGSVEVPGNMLNRPTPSRLGRISAALR